MNTSSLKPKDGTPDQTDKHLKNNVNAALSNNLLSEPTWIDLSKLYGLADLLHFQVV
jgi:hypothetical protein